ncbi:hypothetical protein E2C01_075444 [Portunus trituberculatus]|uniref:Secreted protein n=1 Tax=Portunus trituberculatus TaxID=210409 RepID=A0A5B7I642_PORTR|nr:hypothetical protein [Portunus trituberculatus]
MITAHLKGYQCFLILFCLILAHPRDINTPCTLLSIRSPVLGISASSPVRNVTGVGIRCANEGGVVPLDQLGRPNMQLHLRREENLQLDRTGKGKGARNRREGGGRGTEWSGGKRGEEK